LHRCGGLIEFWPDFDFFFFHFGEFSYCILAEYENKGKLNYGNLHIKIFTKDQTVTTAAVV
jgi:hypothetical protein